ncbi:MAG: hypothetical protein LBS80_03620 [Tannerella sp.]|jgi:hypothetical protein|nr:hypothetical protein [Tannerella sp.]
MSNSIELGSLANSYRPKRAAFVGLIATATVLACIGIFCLWAISVVSSPDVHFSGLGPFKNPATLLGLIGGGILLIALFLVWVAFKFQNIKYSFWLYENGIVKKEKGKEDISLLFSEIEDVLIFAVGGSMAAMLDPEHYGLAYRKSSSGEWSYITPQIHNSAELLGIFRELHTEQRGKALWNLIEEGRRVSFNFVEKKRLLKNNFLAISVSDITKIDKHFKPLFLSIDSITIDAQTFKLEKTDSVKIGDWTDNIYLLDENGNEKMALPYSSVASADIFTAILAAILKQEKRV